jgi:hypothetical protein
MTEVAQILGYFFPNVCMYVCINFDKTWVGLHIGRLFNKLIWSPCLKRLSDFFPFRLRMHLFKLM